MTRLCSPGKSRAIRYQKGCERGFPYHTLGIIVVLFPLLFHSGDTKPFKQCYRGDETVVVLDAFL